MVIKYLLATLSALANKFTSSPAIEAGDDSNAYTYNKDSINYLNVSPSFGRLLGRKKRTIDLLPKSIIMAVVLIVLSSVKVMAGTNNLSSLTISSGTLTFAAGTYTYTVKESSSVASVTVTPTGANSTITVNGATVTSGTSSASIALTAGGSTTITVISSNAAGTNTSTYTITVNSESIAYPGTIYAFANNQTITNIQPTSTPDAPTGNYTISPGLPAGLTFTAATGRISGKPTGGASAATNYTITSTYGGGVTATVVISIQITVTKTVTISGTNVTQTYGSVTPTVTYTITGLVSGDSMVALPSVSTTATASSNAGTYPITVTGGQAPAGYAAIVYVNGTFTISKANLSIVATGPPKSTSDDFTGVYPGASTSYFTANGLVNSESISSVYFTMSTPGPQSYGSAYTVTPSAPLVGANGFNTSNYQISYTAYGGTCGQGYTWTGATSRDMSVATNWSPNGIPGSNDNIFIPDSTTLATPTNQPDLVSAPTVVNTITIQGKSRLTLESGQTIQFLNGFTVNAGVKAVVNMRSTTSQVIVGTRDSHAIFDNLGTLTVNGGQVFITWGLNYIYNETSGTMKFQNGNTLNIGGTSGQLAFQNNGFFYAGTPNSPCTLNIVNSQSVTNGSTGNFYLGSTSTINFLDASAHDSHFSNTAGGNFTIQSDVYGSGAIGNIPAGPSGHTNSFDGLFTVESYISGNRGYRLMASPVYAATSGSNKVYSLNYVQNFALISGTSASGGFDKVTQGPTLYLYREDVFNSNASFISGSYQSINNLTSGNNSTPTYTFDVTSGSYSIPVSNGFLFFYRGDRNSSTYTTAQEFTSGTPAEPTVMSTTGYLNQQQVVFRDWYTPASTSLGYTGVDPSIQGFNFVANPYACSIDLSTMQSTTTTTAIYGKNLSPFIYELNPYTNNYDTYNTTTHVVTNNGTKTIMSGQGFFVQALNASAQLNFNEGAKSPTVQNTGVFRFMGKPADQLAIMQSLRIEMKKDTINKDNIFIGFDPNAKSGYDIMEDALYKMGSGKVNLASMSNDNSALAVNSLPFNKQGQTIPLRVGASASGNYQLNLLEINAIPKLFDILLVDKFKNDTTDMRQNSSYSFDLNKTDTNTFGKNRFAIVMRQNPVYAYQLLDFNAKKATSARQVQVIWNTKYEENYTNFTVQRSIDGGNTFAILGGVPATGAGNYGFTDNNPVSGMNLYRLMQEDINGKITYSTIVPIGYSTLSNNLAQNGINVFPNPASSKINLAIATPVAGASSSYNIMITNSSGNMLKKVTSNQPYWQGDATGWMPGTYMVKVFDGKTQSLIGTTKFIKL